MEIRPANSADAAGINEIGNHYIVTTPANFKIEELTLKERQVWMQDFAQTGRHRLLLATERDSILGYACSTQFDERSAYQTSIATTIYLHPEYCKHGLGTELYSKLFEELENEDLNRAFAGITLPNEASIGIHKKFGFKEVGIFTQAGHKHDKYWDVLWMEKSL